MALKFLNKKGWHTGSLRNVENVWKAEQKHEAEQKKLEELRKQIHEERERAEFRQLQEEAGLVPRQERLDFLYESGLAVGKGSSGFKALESVPKNDAETTASSSAPAKAEAPGALFEDKPHSANDAWRKLHTDPLLMMRQREQEALARIKNNPVQMAMIRKSAQITKGKDKEEKKKKKKKHEKSSKHHKHSSSEDVSEATAERHRVSHHKGSKSDRPLHKIAHNPEEESSKRGHRRNSYNNKEYKDHRHRSPSEYKYDKSDSSPKGKRSYDESHRQEYFSEHKDESHRDKHNGSSHKPRDEPNNKHKRPVKLSEEQRAAKLREMQMDAEIHEEQRWKRLKKAADHDAEEAIRDRASLGRNFLDATHKSVYGAEKGGGFTIEESVRRRSHYLQGRSATETNAFRR